MVTETKKKQSEIKCLVWDLDNTLWSGTLLEDTAVTLKAGVVDVIKTLDARGILQSISSKNNHDDAMRKLKEFGLDHYFIYPEINWNTKSQSIKRIKENINIGMDTLAFIDDQEFELDEVKHAFPEVECLPADDYSRLPELKRFNPRFITSDSQKRRKMYLDDIQRKKDEETYDKTPEEFLATLNLEFSISRAKEEDLKRAEELTVRTHQLNATGVTYDYDELHQLMNADDHLLLICELTDKYGSYGKIGVALLEIREETWHLKLLLMSCRVMSRGVGTVLITYIMEQTKKAGKKLTADFKRTDRNKMMYVSYKFSNFQVVESDDKGNIVFENDLSQIPAYPPYIKLNFETL